MYLHGYSSAEQRRLERQAAHWYKPLISPRLCFKPHERVLEVGSGVGATMRLLAKHHPLTTFYGVDLALPHVRCAAKELVASSIENAHVVVGNATRLPWPDGFFDQVYMVWFLEHLRDHSLVLEEVRRVLRVGGRVTSIETDYTSFSMRPKSSDYEYVRQALWHYFARNGNPNANASFRSALKAFGFSVDCNQVASFVFSSSGPDQLRWHVEDVADFLRPALPLLASSASIELSQLQAGLAALVALPELPGASFTEVIIHLSATKNLMGEA